MNGECKKRCMNCRFWQIEKMYAERRRRYEARKPWDKDEYPEPCRNSAGAPYVWGLCRKNPPSPVSANGTEFFCYDSAGMWPRTNGELDGCGAFEEGRWD